jgi:tRNA(fMet)-specific endonuclease VapC
MRGKDPRVRLKFKSAFEDELIVGISSVVYFELEYGVAKSDYSKASGIRLLRLVEEGLPVIPFTAQDAAAAGKIRAQLEREKRPISPYDTLIAGQALAQGLTLVTANVREFERVKSLKWVDWAWVGANNQRAGAIIRG